MSELARILSDKKRLALYLLLPVICLALFLLELMGGDVKQGVGYLSEEVSHYRSDVGRFSLMSVEEAEADRSEIYLFDGRDPVTLRLTKLHTAGYADYLENVQAQAERMSASSVFGRNKSGFTYKNIQKTARDFKALQGVNTEFGGNRAVEKWIGFRLSDVLFLLGIVVTVLAFFEDKRCGLLPLVRATPRGRGRLARERLAILFAVSFVLTALIYGGTLAVSFSLYGGLDTLPHAVQSLVSFKTCTLRLTVGGWLALYFAVKVFCGFLLGLIFWFMLSFLSNMQLAWLVIIGVLGAEYAAWAFIPPQMAISILRYVNLFAYIFPAETLSKYVNMNFFGLPVGALDLLAALFVLLTVGLSAGVVVLAEKRFPMGSRELLGKAVRAADRALDFFRSRLPVFGMEWYKLLVLGGAVLFFAAGLWYSPRLHYVGYSYNSGDDFVYSQYLAEAAGPVNEDTYAYIARARDNIDEYDPDPYSYLAALDRIEEEAHAAEEAAEAGGYSPWLCEQSRIEDIFGQDSASIHRWNAAVSAALLILVTAPLFAFERKSGAERLLRSAPRGRGFTFARKIAVALISAACVWAIIYIRQWVRTRTYLGPENLGAHLGNIPLFAGMPVRMTLDGMLALLFILRLAALGALSLITAFISSRSQSWEKAALVGLVLIIAPAVLWYFGREWAGLAGLVPAVSGTALITPSANRTLLRIISCAWAALAVVLTFISYKSWTGSSKGKAAK